LFNSDSRVFADDASAKWLTPESNLPFLAGAFAMRNQDMSLSARLSYRLIKLVAHASKIFFSIQLYLFGSSRKQLPSSLAASAKPINSRRIPRIIWQTNYSQRVTWQVYACFLFNRLLSRTHEYRFCDDEACDLFVKEHFPGEIWNAYQSLQIGAARADFWRVLVLLKFGGVYLDIDANFVASPEQFIEPDADGVFIELKNGEATNYFMASAPGNPILEEVCARIVWNINQASLSCVYALTGPLVLDHVLKERGVPRLNYKKACVQGQFTNKFGQYADKPDGVWTIAEKLKPILARSDD
jgi:mannosyltransferase OCH1-like enzyme